MREARPALRLAYFGDDFTGSTDALEFLSRAGLKTALFLAPPTATQLARFPGLDALGVAGLTRSLAPDAMEAVLRPAFAALRALGAPHVHYKVCSTFDSSPTVGSIGRAIDVGAHVFRARFVPLLVGAPALGRYCVFGNLFARFGIGSAGAIHRLDRHPSISRHPVTPMTEADLRVHLGRQTAKRIGLVELPQLTADDATARTALDAQLAAGAGVVLFDLTHADQLARIGGLIDAHASAAQPLFSVGSSGIEMALGAHWKAQAPAAPSPTWTAPGPAAPLLVISGSCSPVTAGQIEHALAAGFVGLDLDAAALRSPPRERRDRDSDPASDGIQTLTRRATDEAIATLRAGRNVVVFTSRGAPTAEPLPAELVGTALGQLAREAIEQTGVRRLLVAGGDSSSYAARALGIEAVELLAPLAPGAPLCRAHAPGSPADGLEVNFKGGQVGAPDYFLSVARGAV